jgi:4-amino-4-deoxy-L-arabinose transferase-like glycosyltransferase
MPAEAAPSPPSHRHWLAPASLAILLIGAFFCRLGQDMPMRHHEALVAETARNMVLGHAVRQDDGSLPSPWIVPNFNGSDRLRKTPLPYWLVAGVSMAAGGVSELTARLPSAASAVGTVLILLAILKRWTDRRTAYLGAAMLATSVGFLVSAREAQADMLLTFFTTASLAALWMAVERSGRARFAWLLLMGATSGLAMLAKGPAPVPVLALPYIVAVVVMVARLKATGRAGKNVRSSWGWTVAGLVAGMALFAAIFLPWLLLVPNAWATVWGETAIHSLGEATVAPEPSHLYYLAKLPALFTPWSIFIGYGLVIALCDAWTDRTRRAWLLFVLTWFFGTLVGFSAAEAKQDHYILPLVPAAAVFGALALRHFYIWMAAGAARPDHGLLRFHGGTVAVLGLGGVAAYVLFLIDPAFYLKHGMPATAVTAPLFGAAGALGAVGLVAGIGLAVLAGRRRMAESVAVLAAAMAILWVGSWATVWSATERTVATVAFGAAVRDQAAADIPIYYLGSGNRSVIYYAGRNMPSVDFDEVRRLMAAGRPFYLVLNSLRRDTLAGFDGFTDVLLTPDAYRPKEGFLLLLFAGAPARPSGAGGPSAVTTP